MFLKCFYWWNHIHEQDGWKCWLYSYVCSLGNYCAWGKLYDDKKKVPSSSKENVTVRNNGAQWAWR